MSDHAEAHPALVKDSHYPRKIFHALAASIIPLLYILNIFTWEVSLVLVAAATVIWGGLDYLRQWHKGFNRFAIGILGPLLKTREAHSLTSSSYVLMASTIVIALLEQKTACASLFFLAWGDPAAAVAGKRFGRHKLSNGKSWEGSAVMFLICMAAGYAVALPIMVSIAGAMAATLTELYVTRIEDNFAVPVFSGFVMALTGMAFP